MQDLISIQQQPIDGELIQTVNARELHAFLEVGKDFSNWIKDRIQQHGFLENQDFIVFAKSGENPHGGRPAKEYHLTIEAAKHVSMAERTPKGKEARDYFIECERKLWAGESAVPVVKPHRKKPIPLADRPSPLDAHLPVPYFRVIAGYKSALKGQKLIGKDATQASLAAAQIAGQAFGVDIQRYLLLDVSLPAKPVPVAKVDALSVDRTARPANDQSEKQKNLEQPEPVFCGAQELAGMLSIVCSTGQPDGHRVNEALVTMGYAFRRSDNSAYPRQPQAEGLFRMEQVTTQDGRKVAGRFITVWDAERVLPILRQYFAGKPKQLQLVTS